jgi:hypothetical protein
MRKSSISSSQDQSEEKKSDMEPGLLSTVSGLAFEIIEEQQKIS